MKTVAILLAASAALLTASCGQQHKPEHHHQGVLVADTSGHVRPVFLCPDENGGHKYNVGQVALATYNNAGKRSDTLRVYTVVDTVHANFVKAARKCNYAGTLEAVADEVGY